MKKAIRILEIPIYLLVIAMAIYEIEQATALSIVLVIISIARLATNVMFDEFIYKR
tara:strand:- start:186 stop:353 length:168 start_codon:yes stop_codon:yes gene_type:complete